MELSLRMGQSASYLGIPCRRTCICPIRRFASFCSPSLSRNLLKEWRQAITEWVGMAVCSTGYRRWTVSLGILRGPDVVSSHPAGASPLDTFTMTHIHGKLFSPSFPPISPSIMQKRAASLRGGSYYQPQGSMWYFPQASPLMSSSYERAGTIGFRCVVDAV